MLDAIGQYKILSPIGVGQLGELFRARDTRAGRTVALRLVGPEIAGNPERRQRLLTDARAVAALSHPSIAALYEVGEDGDRVFLVSEFVPGDTLRTLISWRALNPRHAIDHAIQLTDALADAHASGISHLDIQPANIVVTPKGMAKFVDFGLSGWTASGYERQRIAAVAGDNAGSSRLVSYMAPEQALGRAVDHRADIFSLGVVLFEMLAGTPPPLTAPSENASTADVLLAPPPAPTAINPSLPRELDPIVLKMLARIPDDRHQSAATLAAELRAAAATLDAREDDAAPAPKAAPAARGSGSTIWVVIAIVAIAAIAAIALLMR